LVEEAKRSAQREEEQEEGEETETGKVKVKDKDKDKDKIIADNVNEAINETEAEENTTVEGISEPQALSSI
jgi:hypothetical protein